MPRHPFDPLSLVFGLLFGAVAVLAFIGPDHQVVDPRWLGPILLMALGLLLLLPWGRRRNRAPRSGLVEPEDRMSVGDGDELLE